ncbi:MAG: hypothetical protein KC561_16500, partial [Myxococcales bacterium]|nr:hypothetical protein [Myxococcales bacterium]
GLALHLFWSEKDARKRCLSEVLVVDCFGEPGVRRNGKRWRVTVDDKEMARFSLLEEAVEAVDYEVGRRGRMTAESARPTAPWRHEKVPEEMRHRVGGSAILPEPLTWGEATRLLALTLFGPKRPGSARVTENARS